MLDWIQGAAARQHFPSSVFAHIGANTRAVPTCTLDSRPRSRQWREETHRCAHFQRKQSGHRQAFLGIRRTHQDWRSHMHVFNHPCLAVYQEMRALIGYTMAAFSWMLASRRCELSRSRSRSADFCCLSWWQREKRYLFPDEPRMHPQKSSRPLLDAGSSSLAR